MRRIAFIHDERCGGQKREQEQHEKRAVGAVGEKRRRGGDRDINAMHRRRGERPVLWRHVQQNDRNKREHDVAGEQRIRKRHVLVG